MSVLIIDEAQSLPDALLEEVRLLANIETTTEKLLSIILIGQPELADRLNATSMRQLKQRVALRCELTALDLKETATYIGTRLRVAGGDGAKIFAVSAIEAIPASADSADHQRDLREALISGFALRRHPIGHDIVDEYVATSRSGPRHTSSPRLRSRASPRSRTRSLSFNAGVWTVSRLGQALRRAENIAEGVEGEDNQHPQHALVASAIGRGPSAAEAVEAPRDQSLSVFRGFDEIGAGKLVVMPSVPHAAVEQYRRLAATLHHTKLQKDTKVVMLTSASPGEGKTLTTVNLALTLSESYRRNVLLIDKSPPAEFISRFGCLTRWV